MSQAFVDRLVDGLSCFLLGGRAWAVGRIDHDRRLLIVESAPRGKKPTWGGILPQFLGQDVCRKILDVLTSGEKFNYLDPEARIVLEEERDSVRHFLKPGEGGIQITDDEIRWWTFAGGRINSTLRYALASIGGELAITPDNFAIRLRGNDLTPEHFLDLREQLSGRDVWEDELLWQKVAAAFPSYRLSKFQPLMPPWIEREVIANYLLDMDGARRWASCATDSTS